MKRVCVMNVVGLTPELLAHAPAASSVGAVNPWTAPFPAVTSTVQATLLTGKLPREHGIVGNGWYYRDTAEIRFWQQANSLIQGRKIYDDLPNTAKMFWWFNQNAPVRYSCTPKPHYGSDGSKVFDVLDRTGCDLTKQFGPFPFHAFWGPKSGIASSNWIANASAEVMRRNRPDLTLVYLPHLDYDLQRTEENRSDRVGEVDRCIQVLLDACADINAQPIIVSEYGLVPVRESISLNRKLREVGLLQVRNGPFGEMMLPGESDAFAVADHQVAHVYVKSPTRLDEVRSLIENIDGVNGVYAPEALELDHARSGELIVLSKPDRWFDYYYWMDSNHAPDFARTVDIHRKPGYDPCELFMTSMPKAMLRLAQKKLGLRYRMDVIPLNPKLVRGSHGLRPPSSQGPLVIGPNPPTRMVDFADYILGFFGV